MPIYEYRCRNCRHELEQLQRMSDDRLTECPECGQSTLERKISAVGFRLAGGGWYETDFKSQGQRNLSGDKDAASGSKDTSDGQSESKSSSADKNTSPGSAPATGKTSDKGKTASGGSGGGEKKTRNSATSRNDS